MIRKASVTLFASLTALTTFVGSAAAQDGDLVAGMDSFTFAAVMIGLVALGVIVLRRYKTRTKAE